MEDSMAPADLPADLIAVDTSSEVCQLELCMCIMTYCNLQEEVSTEPTASDCVQEERVALRFVCKSTSCAFDFRRTTLLTRRTSLLTRTQVARPVRA
jgi:hypothetical protein